MNCHENSHDQRVVIVSLVYQIVCVNCARRRTYVHTHIRTDTHTSGSQLKIEFLDVLDYSEYSDTNISKKNVFTEI